MTYDSEKAVGMNFFQVSSNVKMQYSVNYAHSNL